MPHAHLPEGVAEDRVVGCDEQEHLVVEEGARPVDVKENGIGGTTADSAPVPKARRPQRGRVVGCDPREHQVEWTSPSKK